MKKKKEKKSAGQICLDRFGLSLLKVGENSTVAKKFYSQLKAQSAYTYYICYTV